MQNWLISYTAYCEHSSSFKLWRFPSVDYVGYIVIHCALQLLFDVVRRCSDHNEQLSVDWRWLHSSLRCLNHAPFTFVVVRINATILFSVFIFILQQSQLAHRNLSLNKEKWERYWFGNGKSKKANGDRDLMVFNEKVIIERTRLEVN